MNTKQKTIEDIKQEMVNKIYLCLAAFFILLIIFLLSSGIENILSTGAILFAVMAIIISIGLTDISIIQKKTEEEIRFIELSLTNFYRPIQNLFYGQDDNPIIIYESNKKQYYEIGYYRHLAERDALRYFEICPQTNENLRDLLRQVRKDIHALQEKYKKLKEE